MSELLEILRDENEQLKALLAALTSERDGLAAKRDELQATIESMRTAHEEMVIRLSTEVLVLKRQLFGPKAERIRNAEAQQSLFDVLKDMGRLQTGDLSAGERASDARRAAQGERERDV
jgi:hypothetical protein